MMSACKPNANDLRHATLDLEPNPWDLTLQPWNLTLTHKTLALQPWEQRIDHVTQIWTNNVPQATAELYHPDQTAPQWTTPVLSDFAHLQSRRQRIIQEAADGRSEEERPTLSKNDRPSLPSIRSGHCRNFPR